jgi:hypothetical protein
MLRSGDSSGAAPEEKIVKAFRRDPRSSLGGVLD